MSALATRTSSVPSPPGSPTPPVVVPEHPAVSAIPAPTDQTTVQIAGRREVEQYEGPIPHPEHLAALAKIDPALVDRVVKLAEMQQQHRHKLEAHIVYADTGMGLLGQVLGFAAVLAALAVVAFGYHLGLATAATTLGTAIILGLSGGFAVKQWRKRRPTDDTPQVLATRPEAQSTPSSRQLPGQPQGKKKRNR
jgi:uncharacterized membrane protein